MTTSDTVSDGARLPVDHCVILGGGISPVPLARATGMAVLDLPIREDTTLGQLVRDRLTETFRLPAGQRALVVRSEGLPIPRRLPECLQLMTEPQRYRGPAGAVRDVCGRGDPDAWILVVEGNRYMSESLAPMVRQAGDDADVVIGTNPDSSPAGVYLLRRRVVDMTPTMGFLDLKEQLLNKCRASGGRTVAASFAGAGVFQIRTRSDLLRAIEIDSRTRHDRGHSLYVKRVVAQQKWASLILPNSTVDPEAVLIESVVMDGADVGPGAVVVRSVVCPGAVVRPGTELVERVVTPHSSTCPREESTTRFGVDTGGSPTLGVRGGIALVRRALMGAGTH
ncbi:MAG: hypothetical protein ACF8Q5_15090 [Phycisphaerales bacterium JB040]